MRPRNFYLFLFAVGTLLPLSQFVPWFLENGLDISLFFEELFSTRTGAFFGLDVIVSAVVLLVFVVFEGIKPANKRKWLMLAVVLIAACFAGVSSGFPLFRYFRQKQLDGL